jgi:hypothetical protein
VTSLEQLKGQDVEIDGVMTHLAGHLVDIFDRRIA